MFKCEKCKKNTRPFEKMTKKIVSTREKTYINKINETQEKVTYGYEPVKEITLCETCASKRLKESEAK